MLENTRFDPRETANDPSFAQELADGCDLYVNDAFGSAHRAHASTEGVDARCCPRTPGCCCCSELENLGALLGEVERPFVIVSGGAKVADKVGVLQNLGARADRVLIGGKMAEDVREDNPFTFDVMLPRDVIAAVSFDAEAASTVARLRQPARRLARARHRAAGARGVRALRSPRRSTVFWNGPMGVFEWPRFAEGTFAVARAVADCDGLHGRRRRRLGARGLRGGRGRPASRGSRPAAAPRSSCSRARTCRAWLRFRQQ